LCDFDEDEYDERPRLALWLSQANRDMTLKHCLEQLDYAADQTWWREHRRLLQEAWARVHLEQEMRRVSATLGSWLWSAGADVSVPTVLPSEDAQEEYALLAAGESIALLGEQSDLEADFEDDYDASPNIAWVKKPRVWAPGEERKTASYPYSSAAERKEARVQKSLASSKKAREVRQRQRQLCIARHEKMMLALP